MNMATGFQRSIYESAYPATIEIVEYQTCMHFEWKRIGYLNLSAKRIR